MSHLVYLDNQATTPIDPDVSAVMWPYVVDCFGNPHSVDHQFGWDAAEAIRTARSQVASLINAADDEIVFTSSATESCNLAIRGIADRSRNSGRRSVVTVATEHPAVIETMTSLSDDGYEVKILPVDCEGLLDLNVLKRAIDRNTLLVSVMAVNNEIGVIQPIAKIAEICKSVGALLHTDATQAAGRLRMDVDNWKPDLMSLSSHKLYGPKGVGALYVHNGIELKPQITGGSQERGIRGGTLPTALIVGFGAACRIAVERQKQDYDRINALTAKLHTNLLEVHPNLRLFGSECERIAGNLNIGIPGFAADEIIANVSDRIAISSGSACSSAKLEPSRVLLALGVDAETAATGIRISIGRFNTTEDIQVAIETLSAFSNSISDVRTLYAPSFG